uniref:Uncharacterized protein n=1 Tax=Anguilla anguilla TaxID=7936 RepID=A0A0E9QZ00_ANGAN
MWCVLVLISIGPIPNARYYKILNIYSFCKSKLKTVKNNKIH